MGTKSCLLITKSLEKEIDQIKKDNQNYQSEEYLAIVYWDSFKFGFVEGQRLITLSATDSLAIHDQIIRVSIMPALPPLLLLLN